MNIQTSFDRMNEHDLADILDWTGRRMLVLRKSVQDTPFWCNVLKRVGKVLRASPELTDEEKQILANPSTQMDSRTRLTVVKSMRSRTGLHLKPCYDIINKWILDNLPESVVKTNYPTLWESRHIIRGAA